LFARTGAAPTGQQLQQGRVLGEVALENRITDFDIQWQESTAIARVPWIKAEDEPSHQVIAYRVLSLRVLGNTPNLFITPNPKPIITFFGTENRKDIGLVKLDCILPS
jgi:hypothetical protein